MRIVAWNANMAVHRKLPELVERLQPDVAVVAECAMEDVLRAKCGLLMPPCSVAWLGSLQHKGLGAFAFGDYALTLAPCVDERLQWIAPIDVTGPSEFALLAVWAMNHR